MSPEQFEKRLAGAEPGHIIEYHRGFLVVERGKDRSVAAIANAASLAAQNGRVLLTQRKVLPGFYAYEATVAAAPGSYWTKPAHEWSSGGV